MKQMRRSFSPLLGLSLLIALSGCTDNPSVVSYQAPKASKAEVPEIVATPSTQSGELTWEAPSNWENGKASSMRIASYAVPVGHGDPGDFSLVKLSGRAGGLLANVNRWGGQIGIENFTPQTLLSVLEDRTTHNGLAYKVVTLINSDSQKAIIGGIYDINGDAVFTKLTISEAGLKSALSDFYAFCDSVGTE